MNYTFFSVPQNDDNIFLLSSHLRKCILEYLFWQIWFPLSTVEPKKLYSHHNVTKYCLWCCKWQHRAKPVCSSLKGSFNSNGEKSWETWEKSLCLWPKQKCIQMLGINKSQENLNFMFFKSVIVADITQII